MHGGVAAVDASVQTPEGFTQLGADTIAPLLARGVLLDVADAGHAVGAEDLERAADGLEIHPGRLILVRTGTGALWEDPEAFLAAGGIDASGSRWCAERKPLAVGADNIAWDVPGAERPRARLAARATCCCSCARASTSSRRSTSRSSRATACASSRSSACR